MGNLFRGQPVTTTPATNGANSTNGAVPAKYRYQSAPTSDEPVTSPVIAAIDFGTCFTGYAFVFKGDESSFYTKSPDEREPTCVMLNEDRSFHSFGNATEENYSNLDTNVQNKVYYFRNFKMLLYETYRLSRSTQLVDQSGKYLDALVVFTRVLEHLKSEIVRRIQTVKNNQEAVLTENDFCWILTIPAIWSDSARQFMREAATAAGIDKSRLRLVLEPEAASVFCRERPSKVTKHKNVEQFSEGQTYILADIGGGTVDICAHEILADGKLRELYRASGGYAGGSRVNHEFEQFLVRIFGAPVLDKFRTDHRHTYFEMMNKFERKKKSFKNDTEHVIINIEYDLLHIFNNEVGENIDETLKQTRYSDKVIYKENGRRLEISKEVFQSFFDSSVSTLIDKLSEILEACKHDIVNTIFIAGGYSESPYLRERIEAKFHDKEVVSVDEARLAVMKGAVMMGLKPKNIIERRARFTYGFSVRRPFIDGKHPQELEDYVDDRRVCKKIFHKIIKKGEVLLFDEKFEHETFCSFKGPDRKRVIVNTELWRSSKEDPQYCLDTEDCELVGRIENKPPSQGWPDIVHFVKWLIVGETEFTVKVFNKTTGEQYDAYMDFL